MTELLMFEVNVKNMTEGIREGEDQLRFGILIYVIIIIIIMGGGALPAANTQPAW